MDRVHGVVHGPGPQGWSTDPGPCFVYVLGIAILCPQRKQQLALYNCESVSSSKAVDILTRQASLK